MIDQEQPIGVFDSGVGGLTVLKALRQHLPQESFIYLGDTARLPYGTKSAATIQRYTMQTAQLLMHRGIKMLVVACNTATSIALASLQQALPDFPIIGVIEPGANAAVQATKKGHIAVIATEGTVNNGAYERAIKMHNSQLIVKSQACQLLVALAEEGWHDDVIAEHVIARYLEPLLQSNADFQPDCLVLGCTHFPVLSAAIRRVVGTEITLVDSAHTTALAVADKLHKLQLQRQATEPPYTTFLATDAADRFARIASLFLGQPLAVQDVNLVDL